MRQFDQRSIKGRVDELAVLHSSKLISDEEYEEARKRVLSEYLE